MMRNLPVPVNEEDIDQMFEYADKDKDGKINYRFHKLYKTFKNKLGKLERFIDTPQRQTCLFLIDLWQI